MGLLETLFDTAGRRKRQAEDLREKIAALEVEHSSAVVAADDGAADKIFAKLEKHRADLRAVQAAIDAAVQHTAAARQSAEVEAREAKRRAAQDAIADMEARALAFEEAILVTGAQLWRDYEEATKRATGLCIAAGISPNGATSQALDATKVWNIVFLWFTDKVSRAGRVPRMLPKGTPLNSDAPTVTKMVAAARRGREKVEA